MRPGVAFSLCVCMRGTMHIHMCVYVCVCACSNAIGSLCTLSFMQVAQPQRRFFVRVQDEQSSLSAIRRAAGTAKRASRHAAGAAL